MRKKTTSRFLKAKYHEGDFIQVNIASKSVSISQESQSGTPIGSFLTFEAIEELYHEIQKYKEKDNATFAKDEMYMYNVIHDNKIIARIPRKSDVGATFCFPFDKENSYQIFKIEGNNYYVNKV